MSRRLKKRIEERLKTYIQRGIAPGFQVVVGLGKEVVESVHVGVRNIEDRSPIKENTYFDLASLTKIISTGSLFMFARQQHLIDSLEFEIGRFFSFFQSDLKNRTIRELMEHRGGLEAVKKELPDVSSRADRLRAFLGNVDSTYAENQMSSLETKYSDIGYIILGALLENVFGKNQKQIFEDFFPNDSEILYGPIRFSLERWSHLLFRPNIAICQSIETPEEWLCGEVQDPRAQWLGGIAGHAGLFGTARGVDRWAREIFLSFHGKGLRLSDFVLREFVDYSTKNMGQRFVSSFDTPTHSGDQSSQAGCLAPEDCVGHLGYTGVSFWMDLKTGYRVTLLCHRFQNQKAADLWRLERPQFHDWLRGIVL